MSLRYNTGIIIKPAYKCITTVIMDKSAYIPEGLTQLNDTNFYKDIQEGLTGKVMEKVNLPCQ